MPVRSFGRAVLLIIAVGAVLFSALSVYVSALDWGPARLLQLRLLNPALDPEVAQTWTEDTYLFWGGGDYVTKESIPPTSSPAWFGLLVTYLGILVTILYQVIKHFRSSKLILVPVGAVLATVGGILWFETRSVFTALVSILFWGFVLALAVVPLRYDERRVSEPE